MLSIMRLGRFAALPVAALLAAGQSLHYPDAPRGPVVDSYHGVQIPDPYRWLEDPDSAQSRHWIEQENALTESYFSGIPTLPAIRKQLAGLWASTAYQSVLKKGNRYFFMRRSGTENQAKLYWMPSRNAPSRLLLDPATLSKDGTAAIVSLTINHSGTVAAYGIARSGSDWEDIQFREVETGRDLPDVLEWLKTSTPEWSASGDGVYYGRYPKPADAELLTAANYNQRLMFHKLGTPQTADALIYQRPDHKDWDFDPLVTDDGSYLIMQVSEGDRPESLIFYRDLKSKTANFTELISKFEAAYEFLGNRGPVFYFRTSDKAPKSRIISIDTAHANQRKEIVPESANFLGQAALSGDSLFLVYQKDVASQALVYNLRGGPMREIPLPGKGSVDWQKRITGNLQFFLFGGFTQPETAYSFDAATQAVSRFEESKLAFDPERYETRQIFFPSKDGTRIPMFLVGRKGFRADPSTPCLLYGYGGFDISLVPHYQPLYLQWIEGGGIVASANLRGGDEYGEDWHRAGMKLKKQNVFDDFLSAAEWLIANHYTSTPRLGIYGHSNGGLLIGAVLNQRPDLFGAAVAGAGVMDMLRFPKFTVGYGWTSDYGSPDDPKEFQALRAYSPLHNIRPGVHYPPTLILTADHDDRVVPAHGFKYAAALQHAQSGPAPILIRIETSAGHGAGTSVTKRIDSDAAVIAFFETSLGMHPASNPASYLPRSTK